MSAFSNGGIYRFDLLNIKEGPTLKEITEIVDGLDKSKAVYGEMKIELLKITGVNFKRMIHRCVTACFESSQIPEEFRVEKMILLYKHKGKLDELDNYRGIFLRLIILTIYQKWLYMKCAPTVDENGSDMAFGGRKGKSTSEALLIVKLIQDHANWTKEQIIFKFLDVEKFFDSMNFKKSLIDLYSSGVDGKYWKAYESINKRKTCIPVIPSGPCSEIKVEDVFVQGSTDAVLLAWNHMDMLNKKKTDVWSKNCIIQGIKLDAITFVDDIVEICKNQYDILLSSARSDVFQNETRLRFKPDKCKIMVMNQMEDIYDYIGDVLLEIVEKHLYLGTIISSDGKRNDEFKSRVSATKSVCNEIVQILKASELSVVRLRYLKMLVNACVDTKVKYGSSVWNTLNESQIKDLNGIKINLIKRTLELPFSTPSLAIQYDFGVSDLDLEMYIEKVMLLYEMKKKDDSSIGKRLLMTMLNKKVPGLCCEIEEALKVLGLDQKITDAMENKKDIRQYLKKEVTKIQSKRIFKAMLNVSKTNRMLLDKFLFDGKIKTYLAELPFEEARIIFMFRCKMLPTKANFKGRWESQECTFCHMEESDLHLFACAGYSDLVEGLDYQKFITLEASMEELSAGAKILLKINKRLEVVNNLTSRD